MEKTIVMTVMGKDRTGLIESLARLIADSGGNWLESRMCRLGGEFAGILRASAPDDNMQALVRALQGLQSVGLAVIIHQDETTPSVSPKRSATLSLVGQDRPGIIYQISAALANQGINVEELETGRFSGAMSGEMIFQAVAMLQIPVNYDVSGLRKELEEIGSELMVDISFAGL
jgi:glycine cleavage system regulatory protein